MPSLRMLWNHLSPGRRRRRYYALRVAAKLRDSYELTPEEIAGAFNVSSYELAEILRGWSVAPPLIETVARLAYKIPAPSFWSMYGPMLVFLACVPGAIALHFLLR